MVIKNIAIAVVVLQSLEAAAFWLHWQEKPKNGLKMFADLWTNWTKPEVI